MITSWDVRHLFYASRSTFLHRYEAINTLYFNDSKLSALMVLCALSVHPIPSRGSLSPHTNSLKSTFANESFTSAYVGIVWRRLVERRSLQPNSVQTCIPVDKES